MNVRFERAFDDLIASHDVSDEAIDRLYDETPDIVAPNEIIYGLFCGNVAPENMSKYLSRADERRKEYARSVAWYRKMMQEQEETQARIEAEAKRQRESTEHSEPVPQPQVVEPSPAPYPKLPTMKELVHKAEIEFIKIVAYAEQRIDEIERTIGEANITDRITGFSLDGARATALRCLQKLKDDFLSNDCDGWKDVISKIENGELTTIQMVIDYTRTHKSNARVAAQQYDNLRRYHMNNAKELACGTFEDKQLIYDQYRALTLRMKRKPALYVMKIMCETIGNTTMYNSKSGVLTVPIGRDVQYSPSNLNEMTPQDYSTPLAITWATNTLRDSTYTVFHVISHCHVTEYYHAEYPNSSDMLYIGYGMHMQSCTNDNIKPALVYEFNTMSTFGKSCKRICDNEREMKRLGSVNSQIKDNFMRHYFHERNVRYAGFDPQEEGWEDLAYDIAKFSEQMLAKYGCL